MNLHSNMVLCAMMSTGAVVLTLTASARAELLDDFSDGNAGGWTGFAVNAPGAMWDASTGVYRLSAPGVPAGGAIGSVLDITVDPSFSNGFWSATVVRETANSRSDLAMRSDSAKLTGYLFGWAEPLGLFIARSDGGFAQILANQPGFVQDVGEEYILEAGAMGADLELRMWAVGDARPELPQVTATDATYASGTNGLVALSRQDLPGDVSVTFDDVSFVPDPCPWDLDDSSTISTSDLLALLADWGTDPAGPPDFDGDGNVGTSDLLKLLANWGECP